MATHSSTNEKNEQQQQQQHNPNAPVRRDGNPQPHYQRKELSQHILKRYPQYAPLFHNCPSCGKRSLKPVGYQNMSPGYIRTNEKELERKCSNCGYIHKPKTQ